MDGLDRRQPDRQGQAEEIEVGVVVAAMAVPEDAEGEAAPGLGMDRAVEEGTAFELLVDDVRLAAGLGARDALEDDWQRIVACRGLGGVADGGGGFRGLERDRRAVRKRCAPGSSPGQAVIGADFGFRLAQKMLRCEIDPPTGLGLAVGRPWPRRYRTTTARQAGETEAGGVLAPDQVLAPAVLAEAEQDSGIGDADAVVGDGDGETGLAGGLIGERADGDPHPRGVGTTAVLQRLGHDIRKRAGVNPRDPPDGAVVDAGADRPGGRTGNLGHAWTSVRGVETEPPRPACPGP